MKIITKLLFLLSDQEKKKTLILFVLILTMALIDMLGVASILPFIAVLTNSDLLQTNIFLSNVFKFTNNYGLETENQFFILLGALVFILLILSLIMKAVTTYAKLRFTQMREYSIAKRLTESYLHQPYSWFLDRHSADLGKSILSEVSAIAGQGIQPMINLIAQVMVVITLLTLLILVDYKITIVTCFVFLFSYFVIYHLTRSFIKRIGKERFIANQERFKILNEVFGSFKEVKLGNLENYFINKFSNPAKIYAKHQSSSQAIGQLPRYVIEAVAFGGLLIVILYLLKSQGTFSNSIPIISLFAYAGYRLMPAIQQIYLAITQLRYVGPSLDAIYNDLRKLKLEKIVEDRNDFIFNKNITLNQIHYNYPNTSRTALQNINLEIKAKSKVGIIGSTGSGKTTLVDIILGLLTPQKGLLTVDGKILDENNIRSWQRLISYVPQQIFLVDDTIKANIGFGFDPGKISQEKIERAAKIANIHDFIVNELPQQYETIIGENGIRLSGGQRQRIGIARALYFKPKLLVLDEATSALDDQTERKVIEEINNFSKEITIISIAHRLSTLEQCDKIFLIKDGLLKTQGSLEEVKENLNTFEKENKK